MKRMLAMLLAMAMVVTMLPVPAFADDTDEEIEVTEAVEETAEATQPEETEVPTEPETVPEETEETVPEETEAPAETEEPEETLPEETEEPEEVEPEEIEEEPAMDASTVDSGTCGDNLTWTLDADGILTISGTGDMYDYFVVDDYMGYWVGSYSSAPWGENIGAVSKVILEEGVTSIGRAAFCGNCSTLYRRDEGDGGGIVYNDVYTNLTSVIIPDSVTSIGADAFAYSINLTSIEIPKGVTSIGDRAFYSCSSLTSVTIGNSVTSIGRSAFYFCSNVEELYISSIESWLRVSLSGDSSNPLYSSGKTTEVYVNNALLQNLVIPAGTKAIPSNAFCNWDCVSSVTIPDSVTSIGDYAFRSCSSLTSATIGNSVTTIGDYAFYDCSSLTSVTIGNSVTSIGRSAFLNCRNVEELYISSLESWMKASLSNYSSNPLDDSGKTTKVYVNNTLLKKLVIPSGMETIPSYAFRNWDSVTSVTIPNSVTSIGSDAFNSCSSLMSATIGSGVTSIGSDAFSSCGNLHVTFAEGTTKICGYAFSGCSSLTSVTIPDSVTSIGGSAFSGCSSLTSVTIPDSVTSIGGFAFYNCSGLTSVTIGNGVKTIDDSAFRNCSSLATATIGSSVTTIEKYAFGYCTGLKEIHFLGDRPLIRSNTFYDVIATAYYPAGNETYADAGNYDGLLTWKPESTNLGSGTCGKNLTWSLDESGKLTITGTGAMEDFADDATPWNDKLGQIKSVVIESGVTHLGDRAFQYASNMASISLPETLTSCGQYVFNGCTSLTSVKVPNSLTALGTGMFRSCSSLKTVTLPAGLKSMATWAFYGCTSLTSFTVPAGVTEIGRHTFRECTNLTSVNLSNVTKLDQYAFAGCTSLKSIELPDTLISIETRAFQNCSSLKSIVLPNSVTAASDLAFSGCSSLTEVTLSESMTELKYQLFKDCSSLTSIVIPEKVATIGSQVFSGCSKLKTVTFQGDAPKIGGSCFSRTFTANYPCSGKGWSSAVFSNTGAVPTMVKYHPEKYCTESARVEPTCTEPGSYGEILCGSCGAKIKDATAIPAKGHSYEAVVTAPTCTEKGFTTYTCTVCGDSYVGDETELAPHTFEGAWFSSKEGHWHYCAVCNAQGPVEAHVPDRNAPTVDADQLCKLCGYVMQTRKPLIVIDAPRSLIVAGTSLKLSYHVVPEQDIKVVWKLGEGDEAYATLPQTGELTAKAVAEQHTITVYAEDAAGVCVAGKMSMSVCPVPTSITILEGSSFTVNVNEGGSLTLTAKCGPAGCAGNVIWKTSDTAGTYGSFRDNGNNTCTLSNLKLPGGKAASITLTASVYGTNVKSSAVVKLVSAPVPGSIQVTGPETLCGGAAGTYKASVNPDQPLTGSWVYALRSQDSAYASITAAGKLTTKAVPEAVDVVVSAYTRDYPDVVGTTVVHLVPSVQEITIQSPEAVVNDGVLSVNLTDSNTIRLEAAVLPTSAMQTGTWKTSSAAIAMVNSSGQVTFQKTGTVTITFTANDGSKKTASVKICAGIPAMNLQISGDETLASGGKAALKATFSNIPTVKKLTWSSSDPAVATVTASGAVTAKTVYEEKTVTITAKATDGSGQTAEHVITVQPKANVLPVWDASGNVVTNQTLYLDTQNSVVSLTAPAGAKWTSSAPKVVEVVNGRLTLQKAGSAVITVKSADGKQTAKVTIKVSTLVRSLTINTDCSVPLTSGKGKLTLKASVNVDATNKAVTWTSSDPGVASVTSAGAVTAKAGVLKDTEVTITATAKDGSGVTAQATIKVIPASTAVHVVSVNALTCADGMQLRAGETLNGRTITLPVSRSFSLGAKVFPNALGAHADQSVTWKSSSAKIAKVDANGVVTALKAGTVTITVKTADGKTNTVKIKFV